MSKKDQTILISPPLFLDDNRMETMLSKGHLCSTCHGQGWIWGESEKVKCKTCKGTGKLDAVITIQWGAAIKK